MTRIHHYRLCGLMVSSAFELPAAAAVAACNADVTITRGAAPAALPRSVRTGVNWQADERALLLDVSPEIRFLVQDGTSIVVDAAPHADPDEIALWLTGSGIGAILHQRGRLVLHGSAVLLGDRAAMFCGASGAGKSTMAAALAARGFATICDDVCALEPAPAPYLHTDGRKLKLFEDSLAALGLESRRAGAVHKRLTKHYVTPPAPAHSGPYPLCALYLLESGADFALEPVKGTRALFALREQTYRPQLVDLFGHEGSFLRYSMAALPQLPVFRLRRPDALDALPQVLDRLITCWRDAGLLSL
jgi:hypothetical protein